MKLSAGRKPERRRHPRAITEFSAVLYAGGPAYAARVVNLSMGGALLDLGAVTATPPINAGDAVSIDITHDGVAGPLHLDASAVLWNVTAHRVPLLAIQFKDIAEADSDVLEELMVEALAQIRGRSVARTVAPQRQTASNRRR